MSVLDHLIGDDIDVPETPVMRGRVVTAPTDAADTMAVVLPNFSTAHPFEVPGSQWAAGPSLPAQGDVCIVLLDDYGDAWVPMGAWNA